MSEPARQHTAAMQAETAGQTTIATNIVTWSDGGQQATTDMLAVEYPLEIHIAGIAPLITMRTPGHDRELAAGLLFGEGVIRHADDIVYLKHSHGEANILRVMLRPDARDRLARLERTTLANSACGVCGKASFRPPQATGPTVDPSLPRVTSNWLLDVPGQLRAQQSLFESTGGLHAAGLFASGGELLALREDVGRHNAVDKLIGHALLTGQWALEDMTLALSGRASYELLQKAANARIPIVCAISAPSSYAVELATQFSMTLVGFIRDNRFNVYCGASRIDWDSDSSAHNSEHGAL